MRFNKSWQVTLIAPANDRSAANVMLPSHVQYLAITSEKAVQTDIQMPQLVLSVNVDTGIVENQIRPLFGNESLKCGG